MPPLLQATATTHNTSRPVTVRVMCRPLKVDMVAIGMVRHPDHILVPVTDDPDRAGIRPAGSDGPPVPVLVGVVKGGIA